VTLTYPAQFKSYEPPVKLNNDERRRLEEYSGYTPSPVISTSSTMPSVHPGSGGAAGGPDGSPAADGTISGSRSPPGPVGDNNHDGSRLPAGTSLALHALYANEAVKHAFMNQPSLTLDLGSDDDDNDDDDDDNWEDNMDPITFVRYYAAGNPLLAKIVQEHDQKMRERRDQQIVDWIGGVQFETS
jgi:hypothetical protein